MCENCALSLLPWLLAYFGICLCGLVHGPNEIRILSGCGLLVPFIYSHYDAHKFKKQQKMKERYRVADELGMFIEKLKYDKNCQTNYDNTEEVNILQQQINEKTDQLNNS